jgi:hypothetical protein
VVTAYEEGLYRAARPPARPKSRFLPLGGAKSGNADRASQVYSDAMAASAPSPKPIDPRGPRANQAVLTVALLAGFLFDWEPVAPIFALVLFLGAAFGPRYGPVLRVYADVIRPRLAPPAHLEDPRPPRFAAAIGVIFLVAATIAFAAGAGALGWALCLVVAALAGLAATTGICVGCEVWLFFARRKGVELAA